MKLIIKTVLILHTKPLPKRAFSTARQNKRAATFSVSPH